MLFRSGAFAATISSILTVLEKVLPDLRVQEADLAMLQGLGLLVEVPARGLQGCGTPRL